MTEANLTKEQILRVLIDFMYSLGVSIENINEISPEEILIQYNENPTIGNALIAQALYMQDTWFKPQKEKDNKNE